VRAAVVGVGNTLMRDDGVGVYVVRALERSGLPEGVDIVDAGTSTDAAFALAEADRVIVLDAARLDGAPGTVYRLTVTEASSCGCGVRSCHDVGLVETLRTVLGGREPEIVIFGVEPEVVGWGIGLTPNVEAAVPRVIELVKEELKGAECS